MRWGEAVALRPTAFDQNRIHVREAATEVAGKLTWGSPKSHEDRTIILPRFVAERFATHLEGRPKQGLAFTAAQGGPLRTSNFRRSVWLPAVQSSGVSHDLLVHDLRDTAASLMISSGTSIKAVQRALGHASARMTLDVYGGLFDEDLEDLAERMSAKWG